MNMKLNLVYAAALGLLIAAPALAAPNDNQKNDKHRTAVVDKTEHGTPAGSRQKAHTRSVATHTSASVTSHNAISQNRATTVDKNSARSRDTNAHLTKAETVRSAASSNRAKSHSSVASLQVNVQSSRHFQDGVYRAPADYQARHWSHGERLPRGYYARNYWIGDYMSFGLFAPPSGLVWVRVGDDALLIDEYSGDIVQVDYGVFY